MTVQPAKGTGSSVSGQRTGGMRAGLTSYGAAGLSLSLRGAFFKGMGYSDALDRPITGIAATASGYNACHATMPDLIEAVKKRGLAGRYQSPSRTPPRSPCAKESVVPVGKAERDVDGHSGSRHDLIVAQGAGICPAHAGAAPA